MAELHNGMLITYSHSTFVAQGARTPRLEIYGEKGTLVVYGNPANARESVFIAKGDDKALQPVPIPADLSANWEDPRHLPVEEQYIQWIQGGPEPSPVLLPFEEAPKNMEFAEAFVASSRQDNIWVDMPQH
jgi:predicted dehydrogenase